MAVQLQLIGGIVVEAREAVAAVDVGHHPGVLAKPVVFDAASITPLLLFLLQLHVREDRWFAQLTLELDVVPIGNRLAFTGGRLDCQSERQVHQTLDLQDHLVNASEGDLAYHSCLLQGSGRLLPSAAGTKATPPSRDPCRPRTRRG